MWPRLLRINYVRAERGREGEVRRERGRDERR